MKMQPFEARQFSAACRLISIYCLIAQVVNYFDGLPLTLNLLIFIVMGFVEWMRRRCLSHGLTPALQWSFALSTSISLIGAWVLNGGLQGPVPGCYLLALFLALSFSEEQRLGIFCLYLVSAVGAMVLECLYPQWLVPYANRQVQFLDGALGLLASMFTLAYGTHQFKGSYDVQRRRLQEKTERMQSTNRNLQGVMQRNHEHLHIIAHDLRNPIGAVIGIVDLCREEHQLSAKMAKDLDTIEQAAVQALELVQQLSEVAHLEERKVVLQKSIEPLEPLLEKVIRKLEPQARRKFQHLQCQICPGLLAEVDSHRLASILDNLLENAIKYSPLHSVIELILESQDHLALVRIRDSGPGIPAEYRDRLFTMFGKAGTRPTGKETSTGLGLYIARMLSELHGGRIEHENLNPGSEFRLFLPLAEPQR